MRTIVNSLTASLSQRFARRLPKRNLACIALLACAAFLLGQSVRKRAPEPTFSELSPSERDQLDQQRAVVADAVRRRYGAVLTKTKNDLPVLQKLLDDRVYGKSKTYELQCLGVVFGDVLARQYPLRWVMITDEYGTDPTLRFRSTSININALTMISKRIEGDQPVSLTDLLRQTGDALSVAQKKFR